MCMGAKLGLSIWNKIMDLKLFENKVLRRNTDPRELKQQGWVKLYNKKLCNFYSSSTIMRVIKSRRMRWTAEMRNAYKILVGKPERKRRCRNHMRKWEDNITMDLFTTASRTVLGPTQPPIQWVLGAPALEVKQPRCEADPWPSYSAEVKEWVELYFYSPHTPSWRGAQLKEQE